MSFSDASFPERDGSMVAANAPKRRLANQATDPQG
jgi:hypothetical protein